MLNQIILMGRLTKDPEVRKIGEKQISKGWFTLAVDRPKYGDAQPQADFIPVVVWRSTAEFVGRNFHKGKQVYVVGRLQTRNWQIQHPIPLTEFLPAIFLEMLTDFLMIFPALEAISVMRKLTRTPCHSK